MTDERWERIEDLFHLAADLPPANRKIFLDSNCEDPDLRREVESLLVADQDARAVLGRAVSDAATSLRTDSESSLPAGSRIGRYSIVGLIGRGGMGAVYRAARDGDFRMEVALKLIKRGADTDAALGRFRKERQILAGLQHPNIARLLDGGATEDGLPYFAMEYVEGQPLLEYAAPLSVRQRLELFRSVCAAVQYAHQNLVVHRDLKPGNILVTGGGTPKLLDFGIAKLLDPGSDGRDMTRTVAGAMAMTPDYASPEQIRGEAVTTATDVYSLGVILFELLTGERPHRIDPHNPEEIERAICRDEPRRPGALNRDLDPDLDNICLMALRKEPQRRYGSVEQLSEDVHRHLEGRPVRARKDTFTYRATKFVRRNKVAVAAAVIAAAGATAAIVAVNRQARRAEYRFQQVRKLAHSVLFELNPEIENLAGSTRARELLVKTSLVYLDSLAAEGGADPGLQLELAQAYEKIGDIQGAFYMPSLGNPEAALQSYGRSLRVAEKLEDTASALEVRARANAKIGQVQRFVLFRVADGREHLRRAAEIADSIVSRTGVRAYELRADVYGSLGDLEFYIDPENGKEPYRRSLEITREWVRGTPTSESRYFLARAINRWAQYLRSIGDLRGALDSELEAFGTIEKLCAEKPGNPAWTMRRIGITENIGGILGDPRDFNLGDRTSAALWLQRTLDDSEALAADRDDRSARRTLSNSTSELAGVIGDADPVRAEQLFRRSLQLSASLLQEVPEDLGSGSEEAFHRVGLASLLRTLGRRREALEELQKAAERLGDLLRRSSEPMWFGESLGAALEEAAACRLEMDDAAGAERDLNRALGLLEPLYRQNPKKLAVIRDLADCHQRFGDLAATRSDWKRAELEYRKSLDLWERWKQVGVSSVYDQRHREVAAGLVARAASRVSKTSFQR